MPHNATAHLLVVARKTGPQYYAKWRTPHGRQIKRLLGPAWLDRSRSGDWTRRRGRVPDGWLTEKEAIVQMDRIVREHSATLGIGGPRTFRQAAEDWLGHGEHRRGLKRSTLNDYRQVLDCYLLGPFGDRPIAKITTEDIQRWHADFPRSRTAEKLLMIMRAIMRHAQRRGWIAENPAVAVERHPVRYSGDYDLYSREEVDALIRAAPSGQDAAIYATASMTGLRRGELVALRWRDVDFAGQAIRVRGNYSNGQIVTPKSGRVRVVPMVPEVARHLAKLGQREHYAGDDDPVFANTRGGHLDASALRRRYVAAARRARLRPLPFHSLRHHFGSTAVNRASLVQVQAWMGHSEIQTTARYLHHRSQASDAALLAQAFAPAPISAPVDVA